MVPIFKILRCQMGVTISDVLTAYCVPCLAKWSVPDWAGHTPTVPMEVTHD